MLLFVDYVHTMYYSSADVTCEGDYYINSRDYTNFFGNYGDDLGKREYYSLSDYTFDCSDTMFSDAFTEAIGDASYATEL